MTGSDARIASPAEADTLPDVGPEVLVGALRDIILTVGSSLDPSEVMQRVVEVIAEVTEQADAYIYLHDEDAGDLVLSAATPSAASPLVGQLRLELGDGVTGWVGATREKYIVPQDLHVDPRYAHNAALEEDRYDGVICVPIISRSDRLIGVVSVWSTPTRPFRSEHVRLAEWIAVLVAGAVENALMHASTKRQTYVLERMSELSRMATSKLASPRVLDLTTDLAQDVGVADVAVMLIEDASGSNRLFLKSVSAANTSEHREIVRLARRELLAVDEEIRRGGVTWSAAAEQIRERLSDWFGAATSAPLRVGTEDLGVLLCYRMPGGRFSSEDEALLATIANQAALALKNTLLSEELLRQNELNRFLRDLVAERLSGPVLRQRARAVGLGDEGAYRFIVGVVDQADSAAVESAADGASSGNAPLDSTSLVLRDVARNLDVHLAGAVCTANAYEAIAVVPEGASADFVSTVRPELEILRRQYVRRSAVTVRFGVSAPAPTPDDFRRALTEAREVVALGATLDPDESAFIVEDVGYQLMLAQVADAMPNDDRYTLAVETIAEYDRVKGGALVPTLEAFLDLRTHNEAARELVVHRNTVRQRLQRIEALTGLDLSCREAWFPLQLALKVNEIRRARRAS
ncbi:MAG: GAF domain-containing protein [Solirubrobacterales bacterium]